MSNTVGVISMGCCKNTVDSERLLKQLRINGFELSASLEKADTVIINTCGFIEPAEKESREAILDLVDLKKQGKIKKIIVAGCLSRRYKDDLIRELPEVDAFFGVESYRDIIEELGGRLDKKYLNHRVLSTPGHLAYLKISEGCSNKCSFCAIPFIRGPQKSRPMKDIIQESEILAAGGVKEIAVIGQDTTGYGLDNYGKKKLDILLEKLSDIKGIEWIRLLYAYPGHIPDKVLEIMRDNPKLCKYIDIPLQHISDRILKSMRRGINSANTRQLISRIRETVPGIALRTAFIVGYPGESEEEFNQLCGFVKESRFDRMGVFAYSPQQGTAAHALGDTVPEEVKNQRIDKLMRIQRDISRSKNRNLVGKTIKVIIDGSDNSSGQKIYIGRTMRDAPEVDGEVVIESSTEVSPGKFYNAAVYDCDEYDLFATVK